ncbi:uncharacterized protein si:cabz01007807.1 isoform X2 [Mugil cephalus]|uniref:uncharacterized protein si:cabz01007807.1 isoform X2 n=1 Tax=Mugil cephalus TaxID=48193 RepID=UPI001FB76C6D|nr:uncharacterized protein si:cabz01007807.1 isoform X2 [Mugil cephalus]
MKEETAAENAVEWDENGENTAPTEAASLERRPSIVKMQNMLKRVSQSPFHTRYMTLVSSTSESSGSSANDSQNKQDSEWSSDVADNHGQHLGQNGLETKDRPLLSSVSQESGSKGDSIDNEGRTASDFIFVPPPEFQSSPLVPDSEKKTVENGGNYSEPHNNPFQARKHQQDFLGLNTTANGHLHDVALSSPDLFDKNPDQTQNLFQTLQSKSSDLFKRDVVDPFQPAKEEDPFSAASANEMDLLHKSPNIFVDPFKSSSNNEDHLFRSPESTVENPFYTGPPKEADVLPSAKSDNSAENNYHLRSSPKEMFDVFSSTQTVDPFPSPITRNLFEDVSSLDDPFGSTPSKKYDPFQDISSGTSDIFQPLPSKTDNWDTGEATPSIEASTLFLNSLSEKKLSISDLLQKTPPRPPPPVLPKSFLKPQEIVLTTPQGTKHGILQPTPFTEARIMSPMPNESPTEMTHVQTFKRPPKPLPRTRVRSKPPRPEKPLKPDRPPQPVVPSEPKPDAPETFPKPVLSPLPNPVIQHKPKTQENKQVDPEDFAVFEDVLLIGNEQCVEDWPEDSPEVNPDFKPSGKFKLRRESMKVKTDSDGGSGEDQDGTGNYDKKRDKKFRMSLISRRGSKDKFPDDAKERKNSTLPRKSSKDYMSDTHTSAGDAETDWSDYKKKPLKTKVNQLLRRASVNSYMAEGKSTNGHLSQDSNEDNISKKSGGKKKSLIRRWSEGTVLDKGRAEEEEGWEDQHEEKSKKKMKIKFVPHRGFAITMEKTKDEPKGAHGYTPRKGSEEESPDEILGAHGYTPHKKAEEYAFEDIDEIKARSLQSTSEAAFTDDELLRKTIQRLDEDSYDCKPKKSIKTKLSRLSRRSSKENEPDESNLQKKKSSFSADDLDNEELNGMEDCKPKKLSKLKGRKKHKAKSKAMYAEGEDPPGATSSDFLSEAAQAEWLAAQMDEQALEGLEDEEEEGDTDSLMEWWYTVEQWDEVPSDEENKQDESKSFSILANKVHHGLRLFNKVFTERAEVLWQSIITLHAIADDISNFHQKAKIAGITGGTTTAVGGVTAIAGLALAPFTFGASLVITAVGVGVATAGGITSASAAISDNVNNMQDRKKVEEVLQEYETHLLGIGKILHFINQGVYKLRGHPFLRSGTQHYSEDWEIRRAVQMISLVDSPIMRATEITDNAVVSLQGLFKGMDKYFIKDSRELKKGCKKEIVGEIKEVATVLNDTIVELNTIREELQDATGNV